MPSPKLSDAEEVALGTLWHRHGFMDASTPVFQRLSRHYQWRVNLALLIGLSLALVCWFNPSWLLAHIAMSEEGQAWIAQYVEFRGLMIIATLGMGLYFWLRRAGMKVFWMAFTPLAITMLVLDLYITSTVTVDHAPAPSPLLLAFRLSLITIGLVNIWRDLYTPAKRSRGLLLWPRQRSSD